MAIFKKTEAKSESPASDPDEVPRAGKKDWQPIGYGFSIRADGRPLMLTHDADRIEKPFPPGTALAVVREHDDNGDILQIPYLVPSNADMDERARQKAAREAESKANAERQRLLDEENERKRIAALASDVDAVARLERQKNELAEEVRRQRIKEGRWP